MTFSHSVSRRHDKWLIWLIITSLAALALQLFCLSKQIFIVFQNFYYIPFIIASVRYQKKGFYYSLILSFLYLFLIMLFTDSYLVLLAALIRVAAFVIVAAVIAYLAYLNEYRQLALGHSKERYAMLVANIPGITYRCLNDEFWTMRFISEEITRLTGYPVSDFLDNTVRSFSDIIHPDDKKKLSRKIFEALAEHSPYEVEYRIITSDNTILWVSEKGKGVANSEGSIEWLEGVIIDITEKKISIDALRESRELLKATFNSIGDGVITTDNKGRVTSLNKIAAFFTGWNANDAKGKDIAEVFAIISSETGQKADNPVSKALLLGETIGLANDTELIAKDGTKRQVADSCAPIRNKDNEIVGAVLVFRDVTEEHKLLSRIIDSEQRLNLLAVRSRTVVWEVDEKGLYTYLGEAAEPVYGYKPEELCGKKYFYDLHPGEAREAFRNEIMGAFEQKKSFGDYENRILTKDGGITWVETYAVPVIDNEGKLTGYRGSDKDITPRIRIREALQDSEQRYRSITENSFDLISIIDSEGFYHFCNNSYYEILGFKTEDLIGSNAFDLVHPDERAEIFQMLQDALTSNTQKAQFVCRLLCECGSYKYIDHRVGVLQTKNGKPSRILISGTDITEKVNAEQELIKTNERLSTLLANSGDILFVLNKDLVIEEYYCDHAQELLTPPSLFLGKSIQEIGFPEDSLNAILKALNRAIETQKKSITEYSLQLPKNGKQWYQLTVNAIKEKQHLRFICTVNNITVRKQAEDELLYQYSFNRLVAAIAGEFVTEPDTVLGQIIGDTLAKVSQFFRYDRGRLFMFSDDRTAFSCTEEWFNEDMTSDLEMLQNIPCDAIPQICEQVMKGMKLTIDDASLLQMENMPDSVATLFRKTKSFCIIPLKSEVSVLGFLCFSSLNDYITWKEEQTLMLEVIAKIIADAIQRKLIHEQIVASKQQAAALALVVTANHEINQPLMVIQGRVEMMLSAVKEQHYRKHLDDIQIALERIIKILHSMNEIEGVEFIEYLEGTDMIKLPE